MRRMAITTMLILGMSDDAVRQISWHAPNSKEFYKYVRLSQTFMDQETKKVLTYYVVGIHTSKIMNSSYQS